MNESDGNDIQVQLENFLEGVKVDCFNGAEHFLEPCWICQRFIEKGRGKVVCDQRISIICIEHGTELPVLLEKI